MAGHGQVSVYTGIQASLQGAVASLGDAEFHVLTPCGLLGGHMVMLLTRDTTDTESSRKCFEKL